MTNIPKKFLSPKEIKNIELQKKVAALRKLDNFTKQEKEALVQAFLAKKNEKISIKKKWDHTKEIKEILEALPILEKKNFRISSKKNREEIISPNWVRVKVNPEWDVREYLEGKNKWEQLFTYKAAIRETKLAGKNMPDSWKVYKQIIDQKYAWNYKDFLKWEKIKFCGYRNAEDGNIDGVGSLGLWCKKKSLINGYKHDRDNDFWGDDYAISVRCMKE